MFSLALCYVMFILKVVNVVELFLSSIGGTIENKKGGARTKIIEIKTVQSSKY